MVPSRVVGGVRRAAALRLLGGAGAGLVVGCDPNPCANFAVPASDGLLSKPTSFGSTLYDSDDVKLALQLLSGCGSSVVRIGLDVHNSDFADTVMENATRAGYRVILISPYAGQPVDVKAYVKTCVAIQERYARYNPVWELWNEPNLEQFWGAPPNVVDYANVAVPTARALIAAGARDVWSGGTSGVDVDWCARLQTLGAFTVMNGCAVHSYFPPCFTYGQYVRLQKALSPSIPIHTTETCVPSTHDQVDFIRQMWYIHRMFNFPTMVWCELRDGTAGGSGPFAFPYGLVYPDYAPKPSYYTAQSLVLKRNTLRRQWPS